jgi:peptide/nickel transport system permease protein
MTKRQDETPGRDDATDAPAADRSLLMRTVGHPKGLVGGLIVGTMVLVALLATTIFPDGFDDQSGAALQGASLGHPFGTDEVGRDIFTRTIFSLRTDLSLIFVAVPIAAIIGTVLGLSGVIAPWLGNASQRLFDVILGFPGLVLGITIATVLGPGWRALAVTIAIVSIPEFGRLARAQLLSEQQKEYVMAAQVLGVPRWRVLLRHILPNVVEPAIAQLTVAMVLGVFLESALSLVGLGVQPPSPSVGTLLNSSIRFLSVQQAYVLGPTITLLLLALGLNLLADALNSSLEDR